jgi:hypothetical protein
MKRAIWFLELQGICAPALVETFRESTCSATQAREQRMPRRVRIQGYAIVSADGMIADRNRQMPEGLKIDADVRFFNRRLDNAAVVVQAPLSRTAGGFGPPAAP